MTCVFFDWWTWLKWPIWYLSNWTSNQVGQKNDHLGQNGQCVLINWDIQSSWTKQNDILSQDW
jgi:hypothetical protein